MEWSFEFDGERDPLIDPFDGDIDPDDDVEAPVFGARRLLNNIDRAVDLATEALKKIKTRFTATPVTPPLRAREFQLVKANEETQIGATFLSNIFFPVPQSVFSKFELAPGSRPFGCRAVVRGGVADSAGLRPGDIVLSVNGDWHFDYAQFLRQLREERVQFDLLVVNSGSVPRSTHGDAC